MVTITSLDKIIVDERGYAYEYFHDRMGRHLVLFKKAGSIMGSHFHKGDSLSKNPEITILCSGNMILHYKSVLENKMYTVKISGPSKIEILPYTWHEFYAETDCILLEQNSFSEDEIDTF